MQQPGARHTLISVVNIPMVEGPCILAFSRGDEEAFRQVFRMYYKPLLLFAVKLVGDMPSAEDITADTFVKLYQNRHTFATLQHIRAYLYMASRHACLNWLKAYRRRSAAHHELRYPSHESENASRYDEQLLAKEIPARINELPEKCRAIFRLIFYHSKTTREVAAQLGISEKNVINQKLKAIKLIRQALKKSDLFIITTIAFLF